MLEKRREGHCVQADCAPQSDLICTPRESLGRSDAGDKELGQDKDTDMATWLILRACLFFALNCEIYGMVQEKADKAKSQFNGKKTKSFRFLSWFNSLMEHIQFPEGRGYVFELHGIA